MCYRRVRVRLLRPRLCRTRNMPSNRVRTAFAFVVIITAALSAPITGQKVVDKDQRKLAKLDKVVSAAVANNDSSEQRVIIRLVPGASLALADTLRANGRKVKHVHPSINAIAATITAADLDTLSSLASVASISADAVVIADQSNSYPSYTVRGTLGLASLSPGGSRVGVAVIDSGIAPSSEFDNRIAGFYDFTSNGEAAAPSDGYGHGTHVA